MKEHIPHIRVRANNGFLVARDGLILSFFMRRSHQEVAPLVWRALQTYLDAIPPGALSGYVACEGGLLPLDDEGWEDIRQDMLERPCPVSRSVYLREHIDQVGSYNFEYYGRRLDAPIFARDEYSTSAVSFTLPTGYLMEHGPARIRALALELARELPFSFGYASPVLVAPNYWWYAARGAVRALRDRYPGLDVYDLEETSRRLGSRARGVYWLTFLGQPLLGHLGGLESLRQRLPFSEMSFQALDGERALLSLSEWPDAIDTEQEPIPPQFPALARLLEPFMYEQEVSGWFFHDDQEGLEDMRRWIRRFCP
ncbi:hypothetical protein Q664_47055 [Archangium violaceum Cb vi76]|uniref:DUF3396 domain-containing protein n=2 Tax=Archangium violaceum TaxID=83451 RepID=A0A084SGJ6_9BACT|nr:DUF3396 domain-containing protein [Archangium violaceum]KFA87581.1 hypothetical protein Q664_47055 [Archangium violaceum Cb vi76]